jgi:hypothetical protein
MWNEKDNPILNMPKVYTAENIKRIFDRKPILSWLYTLDINFDNLQNENTYQVVIFMQTCTEKQECK